MYAFFYSLYLSLFDGTWTTKTASETATTLNALWNDLTNWLMNLFGGHFQTLQTFSWSVSAPNVIALVMALITFAGLCFAVWKIVKYTLSIFFYGWRR